MKPYYQDLYNTLYNMNFLENDLHGESIQMVVTSPPYWGLRKYAGEQELSDWGCAYGLEKTPELYVQHTVEILREIKRVLRKDGVVFWNIGDSYNGSGRGGQSESKRSEHWQPEYQLKGNKADGLKPKDLCLIPFRVAIAAQEDGWWVRSIIIWSKPNPMPESVTDRPTESHEYILMLTKSAKYYWDADAVREKQQPSSRERAKYPWHGVTDDGSGGSRTGSTFKRMAESDEPIGTIPADGYRNIRTVWEFPTQPYPEAHFAVFPEKLPELCIKAASKEGDTILDPFSGAGTTLWVAKKLNRKAIGFDISEEYCELAIERIRQQVML